MESQDDEEDYYDPYDEEPPEYDVAERVRLLNEELAKSPTPAEDKQRARSIKFKEDLVDLVAPPPDYPSDEEPSGPARESKPINNGNKNKGNGDSSVNDINLSHMNLNDNDVQGSGDASPVNKQSEDGVDGGSQVQSNGHHKVAFSEGFESSYQTEKSLQKPPKGPGAQYQTDKSLPKSSKSNRLTKPKQLSQEQILVEREGTFELIDVNDLSAEEKQLYLGPDTPDTPDSPESSVTLDSNGSGQYQPSPPRHPRPATASAAQSQRRSAANSATFPRRAQSATSNRTINHCSAKFNPDYQSPYAIPSHLKKIGAQRQKDKEHRTRQEKELKKMEEEEKRREMEDAFEAWKNRKRQESQERKQSDKPEEQSAKDKEKCEAAFNAWMKTKRGQQRRERHEAQLIKKEEEQMTEQRPRTESDKAFRQWLKKKSQDTKKAKKQEMSRARISKLLVRRTRKAMQLARAIQKSQSIRYVDYYGYRF